MHEAPDLPNLPRRMRRPKLPKLPRPKLPKLRRRSAPAPTGPGAPIAPVPAPKPSRKRPPLRFILLAIVLIAAVVLVFRACSTDDEKEVRQTVERFGNASRDKDYQTLCDDLFSKAIVEQLRSTGQPCEVSLKIGLSDVQNPTLEVRSVKVDGNKASAEVDSKAAGQRPSHDTIELIKEDDGWRISSLANQAPTDLSP
jgi:hypothetical protein